MFGTLENPKKSIPSRWKIPGAPSFEYSDEYFPTRFARVEQQAPKWYRDTYKPLLATGRIAAIPNRQDKRIKKRHVFFFEAAKHPSVSAQFWFSLHALLGQKDWSIGQSNCMRRSECGGGRFSDSVSNILSFHLDPFGRFQPGPLTRKKRFCLHSWQIHTSKKNAVNYSWWKKSCTIWDVVYKTLYCK